jgi:hypothetical protein
MLTRVQQLELDVRTQRRIFQYGGTVHVGFRIVKRNCDLRNDDVSSLAKRTRETATLDNYSLAA